MVPKIWNSRLKRAGLLLHRRPRGYKHYLLSLFSERCRLGRAMGKPVSITLEPTNICNLQCPVCETGAKALQRKPQSMSYQDFVRMMDKVGPGANHLMLYYMGEPFLNKDSYRMIRYGRDMGLYVTTCTNGEFVDPEALYDSGINHISFQIGGITQETHQVYRINGDLAKVFSNLKDYRRLIQERGKGEGEHEIELGLIVMRQNENDIERFLKMGQEWGVKTTLISPCVRTPEQGKAFLPLSDSYWLYERERLERDNRLVVKRILPWNSCPWIYYAITVQVDGNVVPCCRDPQGNHVMGNLLSDSLESVWNGREFRRFRHAFSRREHPLPLCTLCPGEGSPPLR